MPLHKSQSSKTSPMDHNKEFFCMWLMHIQVPSNIYILVGQIGSHQYVPEVGTKQIEMPYNVIKKTNHNM